MNISKVLLVEFRCDKSKFWCRLITVDETLIQHYEHETKIQSKQWTAKGEPAPKKQKLFFQLGKWWQLFFGIVILIDYLQKEKNHYGSILRIITWQAEGRTCGEIATFAEKENPISPRQCTVSHLSGCYGKNPQIMIWTAWPSALLTRSSPKRLLSFPSSKNCTRRTEILIKWRGNHLREQMASTIWMGYRGKKKKKKFWKNVLYCC